MTLVTVILILSIQAILVNANVTKNVTKFHELWRVDNLTNDDILYEFQLRAHITDEIWKTNNTIHFILADHETDLWEGLLSDNDVKWTVVDKGLIGKFDEKFIKKYIEPVQTGNTSVPSTKIRKAVTATKRSYFGRKSKNAWRKEIVAEAHEAPELWRVENVTSGALLDEFKDRAHMTEEIWKRNQTIDFVVGKHETAHWSKLLKDYKTKYTVLEKNIKEKIDDEFIKKYINTRRDGSKDPQINKKKVAPKPFIIIGKNKKVIEADKPIEDYVSNESRDEFELQENYYASELWRADNVTSESMLSEFNDRAHMTDEIWKINGTIYFILGKHETLHWRSLLNRNNIKFRILERNIRGKFDDKFIKKYMKASRNG